MEILITKSTPYRCQYTIIRSDRSEEQISLDTKTYLLHDITHFVVEQKLGYPNGFWGMLAQGYTFSQLFGKDNPLTEALRFIEQIVGPVQSVYLGHFPPQDLPMLLSHTGFNFKEGLPEACLADIKNILDKWTMLKTGENIRLEWPAAL